MLQHLRAKGIAARAGVIAAFACIFLLQAAVLGCAAQGGVGVALANCSQPAGGPDGSNSAPAERHDADACCVLHCAAFAPTDDAPQTATPLVFIPQYIAPPGAYALLAARPAPELAPLSARAPPSARG